MKVRTIVLLGAVVALLGLAGCCPACPECPPEVICPEVRCPEDPSAAPDEPDFALNYPLVDGSTSTHPLGVLIACELLDVPCRWESDLWDGTKRLLPDLSQPGRKHVAMHMFRTVVHQGTHGSYVNLIEDSVDLILVARLPSQDELNLAESLDVELDAEAVALDAFVFLTNRHNPVTGLTTKQIQDIYTGRITRWSEVGGADAEINAYQRNENSGSQELMKTLVMKGLTMIESPEPMILEGMMGPINRLSEDRDGIGYSVYFFEEFMAPNEEIKLVAVDGVTPSYKTIGARKYPFTTEVYVVVRKGLSEDSAAYRLRDWLLSAEGQQVVKKSGYVPIDQG